jgi:hypothetical protein
MSHMLLINGLHVNLHAASDISDENFSSSSSRHCTIFCMKIYNVEYKINFFRIPTEVLQFSCGLDALQWFASRVDCKRSFESLAWCLSSKTELLLWLLSWNEVSDPWWFISTTRLNLSTLGAAVSPASLFRWSPSPHSVIGCFISCVGK